MDIDPLFLGAAGALLLLFWAVGASRRVSTLRAEVTRAWRQASAVLQRRGEALAALAAVLRTPLAAEQAALQALLQAQADVAAATQALESRPGDAASAAALAAADAALAARAARVLALVAHERATDGTPLSATPEVAAPLAQWQEGAQRWPFARQVFNDAAQAHDEAIAQFPALLLARAARLNPVGRL
jgi:LemA protein